MGTHDAHVGHASQCHAHACTTAAATAACDATPSELLSYISACQFESNRLCWCVGHYQTALMPMSTSVSISVSHPRSLLAIPAHLLCMSQETYCTCMYVRTSAGALRCLWDPALSNPWMCWETISGLLGGVRQSPFVGAPPWVSNYVAETLVSSGEGS